MTTEGTGPRLAAVGVDPATDYLHHRAEAQRLIDDEYGDRLAEAQVHATLAAAAATLLAQTWAD